MKKIALMFVTIILLPIQVYADSIILNCPDKVDEQADFTCELSGYTNTAVSSLSAQVSISDDLSFIAFIPKNVWKGDGAEGNIELYTADIQKESFPIGTIKLKKVGNNSATITINSVFFYDEKDEEKSINSVSKTININSKQNNNITPSQTPTATSTPKPTNDNKKQENKPETNDNTTDEEPLNSYYLVDLQVEGYDLNFIREETEYTLNIKDETSLKITPILEDVEATYEILGNDNLKNNSIIRIQVTSTDNNIQTYRITIKKEEVKKKNYTNIFIVIIGVLILVNIIRIIINEKNKIGGEQE